MKSREQLLLEKTDAFKKACEAYAIKHAVVAQFVAEPNMPMGFYMEFPASSMLGLPNAKSRILAWWFLASVTMQRDASIVTECIPEERKSEARRSVVRMEQDAQSGSADNQPDSLTAALFGANAPYWDLGDLLHPDFHAMRACLPLVMMYHDVVEVMRSEPSQEVSN